MHCLGTYGLIKAAAEKNNIQLVFITELSICTVSLLTKQIQYTPPWSWLCSPPAMQSEDDQFSCFRIEDDCFRDQEEIPYPMYRPGML